MIAADVQPRCHACNRLLAEVVARPWLIKCTRCKSINTHERQGLPRRTVLVEVPGESGPQVKRRNGVS